MNVHSSLGSWTGFITTRTETVFKHCSAGLEWVRPEPAGWVPIDSLRIWLPANASGKAEEIFRPMHAGKETWIKLLPSA